MKIETAMALAAQCWCDSRTEKIEMDVTLATVFAEMLQKLSENDPTLIKRIHKLNS